MSIAPVTPAVRVLASPVRRDIMDTLANLPLSPSPGQPWTRRGGLTAAALASRLGLHVTTIRFHVDQLVRAGLLARPAPGTSRAWGLWCSTSTPSNPWAVAAVPESLALYTEMP